MKHLVLIALALVAALLLTTAAAETRDPSGLASSTLQERSILPIPRHEPITAWREGNRFVFEDAALVDVTIGGLNSLQPLMSNGDLFLYRRATYKDIGVGDILVFRGQPCGYRAEQVAHQVIDIDDRAGQWSAQTMWTRTRQLDACRVTESMVVGYGVGVLWAETRIP